MLSPKRRRPILAPHGLPLNEEHRELCLEQLFHVGGDLSRVIDGPNHAVLAFVRHVQRLRLFRDGLVAPIVLLSRVTPLDWHVVQVRRSMEKELPNLRGAAWIIFVEAEREEEFITLAANSGRLEGALERAPLFWDADGSVYLVLSARVKDQSTVVQQLELLSSAHGGTRTRPSYVPRAPQVAIQSAAVRRRHRSSERPASLGSPGLPQEFQPMSQRTSPQIPVARVITASPEKQELQLAQAASPQIASKSAKTAPEFGAIDGVGLPQDSGEFQI